MNVNIFNLLRGVSACFVLFWHVSWIYKQTYTDFSIPFLLNSPAWVGVWIFFIISGFLIGKGFKSEKYKFIDIYDLKLFYIRRILRVIPIYYIIVFLDIFYINTSIYFDLHTKALKKVLKMSLDTSGPTGMVGNLWFVCTILLLYLICPFFYKYLFLKIKNNKYIVLFLFVFLQALMFFLRLYFLGKANWSKIIYSKFYFNIDFFFCGFILNWMICEKDTSFKRKCRIFSVPVFIFFYLFECHCMKLHSMLDIGAEDLKVFSPLLTILITSFVLYCFYPLKTLHLKNTLLNSLLRLFCFIGTISFGFFVSHCQVISSLIKSLKCDNDVSRFYIVFLLSLFASICTGLATYFLLEIPISKISNTYLHGRKNNV